MKVDPTSPADLILSYWGNDRSKPQFEIFIDDHKLVTETLPNLKLNQFFDEEHSIPTELTKGKSSVVVKIQAIHGHAAGSVTHARTVRHKG